MGVLKQIFYGQFADIRRSEWPKALLLSAFFFLVIATYWILKPIKRGVIINYFGDQPLTFFGLSFAGAEAEQFAKVLNVVAVYVVVIFFTRVVNKFSRQHLVLIFALLFSVSFAIYAELIRHLNQPVVWSFYVFGDMFNTAMVALFWAFTNDIVTSDEAKRTYFLIGLGGVLGGFFGATVVTSWVEDVGRAPLLLFCIVPMVLITGIAYVVHRMSSTTPEEHRRPAAGYGDGRAAILDGAKLVFASRYLLAIAAIIASYELVSNIIDFQLAATVERSIMDNLEKDAFFGLIGQVIGIGSIAVQFVFTSVIMKRFGLKVALAFLPVAILIGSVGFLILPTLLFAGLLSASDNSLNYSINQSAKEALYTPTSPDVTYKAKAFIDMFVQRFAKVVSVVLNLIMYALFVHGLRWLAVAVLLMLFGWIVAIRYVGKRFDDSLEGSDPSVNDEVPPTGAQRTEPTPRPSSDPGDQSAGPSSRSIPTTS